MPFVVQGSLRADKMEVVDWIAGYWLIIKLMFYFCSIVIFFSGLDDAFIDLYYWTRRIYRGLFVRNRHPQMNADELYKKPQQYIAIMVPAWQEAAVIRLMAEHAAKTFDYDHYHIFIGTYPNDPATQEEVDKVTLQYPNLHKVVTRDPGPTTKADCLNNVIDAIFKLEKELHIEFACICYHDSEDVIHPLELRLFNYLIPRKDLVQLPVLALPRKWYEFVGGHYMDEFAEAHGKDIVVRESLTGNVPSAGVATAFSRRAIAMLSKINNGLVFDTGSLTEDYEIGYRLRQLGAKEIFVDFPVFFTGKYSGENMPSHESYIELSDIFVNVPVFFTRGYKGYYHPSDKPHREVIAVREYFPNKFKFAVKQKSRWIVGIVFQGWKNIGWPKNPAMFYIMLRDRKAILANPAILLAYFLLLNLLVMEIATGINDDSWWFPSLIPRDSWLWTLLAINGLFFANRLVQRFYFTSKYYGIGQGLLAIPRTVAANFVNVSAFFRALLQVSTARTAGRTVEWDKTSHEFPSMYPEEEEK